MAGERGEGSPWVAPVVLGCRGIVEVDAGANVREAEKERTAERKENSGNRGY